MSISSAASCSSEASTVILDDSFSETPSKILRRETPREAAKNVSNCVNCRILTNACSQVEQIFIAVLFVTVLTDGQSSASKKTRGREDFPGVP